jgi:two-component system, response regulator, stage 0 sporulation protein F
MNEKITILYVDDEPINLTLFTLNFKSKYNILTAKDGFQGMQRLQESPEVLVVVSDMKMPGMNGIEFISLAKKDFPNICYFILTGFEITDEIQNAIEGGLIQKYFRKPFNIKEIEKAIADSLPLR